MEELATRWNDVLDLLDADDRKVVLFEIEGKTRAQQEAMLREVYAHISDDSPGGGKPSSARKPQMSFARKATPRSAPASPAQHAPWYPPGSRLAAGSSLPFSPTRFKDNKWEETWRLLDLSDVRDHPLWLMDLHDVLFGCFHELHNIFTHYCKSISGAETARDAELMDMQEWLAFIRDCKIVSKSFNRGLAENVFVTATSHVNRPRALGDVDRQMAFYEFVEAICRCAYLRENYSVLRKLVSVDVSVEYLLDECILPYAQRDVSLAVRLKINSDAGVSKAFEIYGEPLWVLHAHLARQGRNESGRETLSMEQFLELLQSQGIVGDLSVRQLSEVRVPKHTLKTYRSVLTVAKAKRAFVESQRAEEASMGTITGFELSMGLDYEEFLECLGRCGLLKYDQIEQMRPADRVTALILNVLGRMDVPSVITAATLVRALSTFVANRDSQPLPDESEEDHAKFLEMWSLLDLSDVRDHPEFNHDLHDFLQQAFAQLRLIFPFYCKSISGAENARDAELMDMQEWLAFIRDCKIVSKSFNRGLAENVFVTSTSHVNRPKALGDVDRQMAFYEFVEAICRCAYLRENYSSQKRQVPLPECVAHMLDECILPYAQRDMSFEVRVTLEADAGVRKAFEVYGEPLWALHSQLARQRRDENGRDTLSMEQFLELLQSRGIVGDLSARQESEVRVPKHTLKTYRSVLTVAKAKRAFVESQRAEEASMGTVAGFQLSTELDYEEFLECLGRCGLLKYDQIEQMRPADRVTALILNVLGRMDVPSVITAATLVRAPNNFNSQYDSVRLTGESEGDHAKWLSLWRTVESGIADLHGFPLWLKDVHNILHESLPGLDAAFTRVASRGGEFELDFSAWQHFARSAAASMPDVASEEDAVEVAELVFGVETSTISGVQRLNFQGFVAALPRLAFGLCNPQFGKTEAQALGQVVRSARVKPVPWALMSLLDSLEVHIGGEPLYAASSPRAGLDDAPELARAAHSPVGASPRSPSRRVEGG